MIQSWLKKHILVGRLKIGRELFAQEQKDRITIETNVQVMTEIREQPTFKHNEIESLYANGLYIEKRKDSNSIAVATGIINQRP